MFVTPFVQMVISVTSCLLEPRKVGSVPLVRICSSVPIYSLSRLSPLELVLVLPHNLMMGVCITAQGEFQPSVFHIYICNMVIFCDEDLLAHLSTPSVEATHCWLPMTAY